MQNFLTSNTGVRIPRIIYGTAWKKADTARLVELAKASLSEQVAQSFAASRQNLQTDYH